jgi:hypothetical protein
MKIKHKLAYMALGGILVFIGQLLPMLVGDDIRAEDENASVEFNTVTCRQLRLVDASGNVYLLFAKQAVNQSTHNVMQVFNDTGKSVCQISVDLDGGFVGVNASEGLGHAYLGINRISKSGVARISNKTGLGGVLVSAEDEGGTVNIRGKDGRILAQMRAIQPGGLVSVSSAENDGFALMSVDADGGAVSVNSSDRKGGVLMSIDAAGGLVSVKSREGGGFAQVGINEKGGGVVTTLDTTGTVTGRLP